MNSYFSFKECLLKSKVLNSLVDEYDPTEQVLLLSKLDESMVISYGTIYIYDENSVIHKHELTDENVSVFISMFISASYRNLPPKARALFKKHYVNDKVNVCSSEYAMKFVKHYIIMNQRRFVYFNENDIYPLLRIHFKLEEEFAKVDVIEEEEDINDDDDEDVEYTIEGNELKDMIDNAINKIDYMACDEED